MAALSLTANAVALVGLADVLIRAGAELYDRFSKLQRAPESISNLLSELKTFVALIARVRIFSLEFQTHVGTVEGAQVLSELNSILMHCSHDLDLLKDTATAAASTRANGWLRQWAQQLSWVLDDQKIKEACERLERHKSALNIALSIIGRLDDIVIRKEIVGTRRDVADTQQHLAQQITTFSDDTKQHFRELVTATELSDSKTEKGLESVKASLSGNNTTVLAATDSLRMETAMIQGQLSTAEVASASRHNEIGAKLSRSTMKANRGFKSINRGLDHNYQQQIALGSQLGTRLSRVEDILAQMALVSLTENDTSHDLCFEGIDPQNVTMALMLMQRSLARLVAELVSTEQWSFPQSAVQAVQSELQQLLALSLEVSARSTKSSSKLRQGAPRSCEPEWMHSRVNKSPKEGVTDSQDLTSKPSVSMTGIHNRQSFMYSTAAGQLHLILGEQPRSRASQGPQPLLINIIFHPDQEISLTGISISFALQRIASSMPCVARFIRPYSLVSSDSKAVQYACEDNLCGLQELLMNRRVSPFDRDENGNTLLYYAASRYSIDTYTLLLQEGADPTSCKLNWRYSHALTWIWYHAHDKRQGSIQGDDHFKPPTDTVCLERALHMTRIMQRHGHHLENFDDPIHAFGERTMDELWKESYKFLLNNGYDLENRNVWNNATPFLAATFNMDCRGSQIDGLKELVNRGADVSVVDCGGRNAVFIAVVELVKNFLSDRELDQVSESDNSLYYDSGTDEDPGMASDMETDEGPHMGLQMDDHSGLDGVPATSEEHTTDENCGISDDAEMDGDPGTDYYSSIYYEALDTEGDAEFDARQLKQIELVVYLLEIGCDPNGHSDQSRCRWTVSDYAAKNRMAWQIWTTALERTGHVMMPRQDNPKSLIAIKRDQCLPGEMVRSTTFYAGRIDRGLAALWTQV